MRIIKHEHAFTVWVARPRCRHLELHALTHREAVVDLITKGVLVDQRELVLTQELYTLAARDPRYRDLTQAWMARSRQALERHFDPTTARILDALIEGLTLHRALDLAPWALLAGVVLWRFVLPVPSAPVDPARAALPLAPAGQPMLVEFSSTR